MIILFLKLDFKLADVFSENIGVDITDENDPTVVEELKRIKRTSASNKIFLQCLIMNIFKL